MRKPVPDSRSSGSEYPTKPSSTPTSSEVAPTTQVTSRGLRYAPVTKTRIRWMSIAAMKTIAAQWCVCLSSMPPRTSKDRCRVEAYASDIEMPRRWS